MTLAAIGQICSTASVTHNLAQCVALLRQAAAAGAQVLFLPEAADYVAETSEQARALAQPMETSPFVRGLRAAAQQHAVAVHVGIHVPVGAATTAVTEGSQHVAEGATDKACKLYNRTIYIDAAGRLPHGTHYDKLHLFDYAAGGLRESAQVQAGTALVPPFTTPVGRIGSLTCFDLRFAEPAVALAHGAGATPAQVLVYPSAFTVATGRAHWEVLLRARAIETQCWVVAAAQVGRHNERRVSYGHSLAIDPWGEVVCRLGGVLGGASPAAESEAVVASRFGQPEPGAAGQLGLVEIDLERWAQVRKSMPLMRRTDVYPALTVLNGKDEDKDGDRDWDEHR